MYSFIVFYIDALKEVVCLSVYSHTFYFCIESCLGILYRVCDMRSQSTIKEMDVEVGTFNTIAGILSLVNAGTLLGTNLWSARINLCTFLVIYIVCRDITIMGEICFNCTEMLF